MDKRKMKDYKVFNDSVHGIMEFHPLIVAIIDTPQFQRLRYLKQLGVGYFVYPGASHNRFEHCLGVCHLAGKLVRRIKEKQQDLEIDEQDVLCVEIAGLCHDLGHGPFSHVFEKFVKKKGIQWSHEEASRKLFDHMFRVNTELQRLFENYGIDESRRVFIKELINGRPLTNGVITGTGYYEPDSPKAFLYEIVANQRTGVDVDKMDYFRRDALHLGLTSGFDHNRYIHSAKAIKDNGQWQICVRDKEAFNMYEMFHTRYALHRRAYKHKTVQAVEIMLLRAMEEADQSLRLLEGIDNMEEFTNMTDDIFHQILRTDGTSKDCLMKIHQRKLHKCVGESQPLKTEKTEDEIRTEILDVLRKQKKGCIERLGLDSFKFVVQIAKLDFGDGDNNPLEEFRFYTKCNERIKFEVSEVSLMIKEELFKEQFVRLFLQLTDDKMADKECWELLTNGFETWCTNNGLKQPRIYPIPTAD